ncbi:MAG: hypothetical protein J6S18_03420 [Oscillospiraceae bacterium]|nr:hypothetical protein [Oscillospiraceae bacterium]
MFYILCAVIFAAAVFGLGVIIGGRRSSEEKPPVREEESPRAEKEAFSLLMGYNADVAYGLKTMKEE